MDTLASLGFAARRDWPMSQQGRFGFAYMAAPSIEERLCRPY